MTTDELVIEDIIKRLKEEVIRIENPSELHLHERYLHHRFSYLVQKEYYEIVLDNQKSKFHPEWATAIDGIRKGGYYREIDHGYAVCKDPKDTRTDLDGGTRGFIDFAVGDFNSPICAIEFKMAKEMDSKGYIFDYMKLLDKRNNIHSAFSLSVVYGRNKPLDEDTIRINLEKAHLLLGNFFHNSRPFWFIVIQRIGQQSYVWECRRFEGQVDEYDIVFGTF